MSYVVRKIEDETALQACHKSENEFAVSYTYPNTTLPKSQTLVTTLLLFESEQETKRDGFWAALKSLFERDTPTYKVILHQHHEGGGPQAQGFVLFEANTDEEEVARKALEQLHVVLKPLLDGQVKLTEALLEELVLPEPVEASNLAHYMVEVVSRKSGAHHDWVKIFNSLLKSSCANDNLAEAKLLAENGGSLEEVDENGDTPIHVAVSSGANSVLEYFLTKNLSSELLERRNSQGLSPLDIASHTKNHEAAKSLLRAETKLAMNPLHCAATLNRSDTIWSLGSLLLLSEKEGEAKSPRRASIGLKDLIDQFDDDGYTPLMQAVKSDSIESCFYLLLGGAKPNIRHPTTGDTALHMASSMGNLTLVKLLTVFEAETAATNYNNEKPLDKAKDYQTKAILQETAWLRKQAREVYSTAPPFTPPAERSKSKYLLSCDGGGVRNTASCQILIAIEKRMRQLQPKCPPLPHFFQHIAATSSGAAAVLFLIYKNDPIKSCLALMLRYVTEVFPKPLKCREQASIDYLKDVMGEDMAMSDLSSPKVMITTTLADRNPPQLHLIRNYWPPPHIRKEREDVQIDPSEWKVWEAIRATSAAPMYLPPFEGRYLDGGLMANNPTLEALAEFFELAEEEPVTPSLGCVLSIGTGIPPSKKVENMEFSFDSYLATLYNLPRNVRSAQSLLEMLVTQVTRSDGQDVRRARVWCKSLGIPYFRFSPPLMENVHLAETKFQIIVDLLYDTQRYIFKNASEIDRIARVILQGSPAAPV